MAERLTPAQLTVTIDEEHLQFETTDDIHPLEGLMGQNRAVQSLAFGLRMQDPGYNIYVAGLTGTGRNSYTKSIVSKLAKTQDTPADWCYVHNFEQPDRPLCIPFSPSEGAAFTDDIASIVEEFKEELPKAFAGETIKGLKNDALRRYQARSIELMHQLGQLAEDNQLLLKQRGKGYVTVPLYEGEPIEAERWSELDQQTLASIKQRTDRFKQAATRVSKELNRAEQELRQMLASIDRETGASVITPQIDSLKDSYSHNSKAVTHLCALENDILGNLKHWLPEDEHEEAAIEQRDAWCRRYLVNLFVDNRTTEGAPVVVETNATYYNLMGMIELRHQGGVVTTDFTQIKAGAIHRANGGYLLLQAEDLFSHEQSWRALKRALKNRECKIENIPGSNTGIILGLKPKEIPLNVKVVVIGSHSIHNLLYQHDDDFQKMFRIKVDFDVEMDRKSEYLEGMASFISRHCQDKGLRPFHRSAVVAVLEHSSRLAECQRKLSTRFNEIVEVISEANAWADLDQSSTVLGKHVTKALRQKRYRVNKLEHKMHELCADGTFLIATDEEAIGQINGLVVYDLGDYAFGMPCRITANTFVGSSGVISIEKEAQLSGRAHNKGVQILTGYLGLRFAQDFPLTLTATLCFEQSYQGVDGDSASSAELYCLLSSLAGVPISQGIAVTGSVNQKGEIQPIGGVNQKIEGFFRVCRRIGLTGKQGVLIPHQNARNLMLDSEVIEAVEKGEFHIYTARTIEEGIELLTGLPAGEVDEAGDYPKGTVYYEVSRRLRDIYLKSANPRVN